MACEAQNLRRIPLFELFDDEELAVLAGQVDVEEFRPRQRIYRLGDAGGAAYVVLAGAVHVTTVDEDQQDVTVADAGEGDYFGFASMLEGTPHQTTATAVQATTCLKFDRGDILALLQQKPHAGMDMLTVLGRQIHNTQALVRLRAARNANEIIEDEATLGERVADVVAGFGGSWTFIILFGVILLVYTSVNELMKGVAWDPYPFILLNLFLSMLAALQAPVIMMSQNRQDKKDRLRGELDYDVNRRAESEIRELSSKLNRINDRLGDLDDLIRDRSVT